MKTKFLKLDTENITYYHFFSDYIKRSIEPYKDKVHLISQFYIDSCGNRNIELQECLKRNTDNPFITSIHLLNERIYTEKELGVKSSKIKQVSLRKRSTFRDFNDYSKILKGYIVWSNADIYFDKTLENLFYSQLHENKTYLCQLRFENEETLFYDNNVLLIEKELQKSRQWKTENIPPWLFGTTFSSDVWIRHSNFLLDSKDLDFYLGVNGCDNRFHYEARKGGFNIISQPYFVRAHHNHKTQKRNYKLTEHLSGNYLLMIPNLYPY